MELSCNDDRHRRRRPSCYAVSLSACHERPIPCNDVVVIAPRAPRATALQRARTPPPERAGAAAMRGSALATGEWQCPGCVLSSAWCASGARPEGDGPHVGQEATLEMNGHPVRAETRLRARGRRAEARSLSRRGGKWWGKCRGLQPAAACALVARRASATPAPCPCHTTSAAKGAPAGAPACLWGALG